MLGPSCNLPLHTDTDQPCKSMGGKEFAFQRSLWNGICTASTEAKWFISPSKTQPRKLVPERASLCFLSSHSRPCSIPGHHPRGYWEARFQPFSWFLLSHVCAVRGSDLKEQKLEPWRTVPYFPALRPSQNHSWPLVLLQRKHSLETMCAYSGHTANEGSNSEMKWTFGPRLCGFPFYSTTISQLNQLAGKKGWLGASLCFASIFV